MVETNVTTTLAANIYAYSILTGWYFCHKSNLDLSNILSSHLVWKILYYITTPNPNH